MALTVSLLGVSYSIPEPGDVGYDQNLTNYLKSLATAFPQLSGGAYALTAELDLGASFGVKSLYVKTETATPATTGVVRLAKTDTVAFRNNANSADLALRIDTGDALTFNGANVTGNPLLAANTTVAQSFANGVASIVVFGTVETDTDAAYNSTTGRFTVPANKGGHYLITSEVTLNTAGGSGSSSPVLSINKNAVVTKDYVNPINLAFTQLAVTAILNLVPGDIIDMRLVQTSGGPVVLQSPFASRNFLAIKRLV